MFNIILLKLAQVIPLTLLQGEQCKQVTDEMYYISDSPSGSCVYPDQTGRK